MDCPRIEELMRYIANKLSEGDSFLLESHLATCTQCAEKIHSLYGVRDNFGKLWDSLTIDSLTYDLFELHLLRTLIPMNPDSKFLHCIETWFKDLPNKTKIVTKITLDRVKKKTKLIQAQIEVMSLLPFPRFTTVTEPVRVSGAGIPDDTIHVKLQDARQDEIDLYLSTVTLVLEIKSKSRSDSAPLVVFVPIHEGKISGLPLIKEALRPEGTDYFLSEVSLTELPSNQYEIILGYP